MRFARTRTALLASALFVGLSLAASCKVDTSDLTFEDVATSGDGGNTASGGAAGTTGEAGASGGDDSLGCEHGTMGCDGRQVQICAGDEWFAAGAACEFVCAAGLCVGSCVPESTQCVSSTAQQTCAASGMWGAAEECPFACIDGACDGECIPGAMGCEGAMPQRCDDAGQWQDERATPCADTCEEGVCTGGCDDPEETQCASVTEVLRCDGEAWIGPDECEFACVGGDCGGSCKPGAAECTNNNERRQCSPSGEWVPSACGDQACVEGECVGVCKPGATRCSGADVEECSEAGQWETAATCGKEAPVCAVIKGRASCAVCQPGLASCDIRRPRTCTEEGKWVPAEKDCLEVCYAGKCYSEEEACDGRFRVPKGCSKATERWSCDTNKYITSACRASESCVDGECSGLDFGI